MTLSDWRDEAACRGDTELWFAGDQFSQRLAIAVCDSCPVRGECGEYAAEVLEHDGATTGVWAGVVFGDWRARRRVSVSPSS